MTTGHVYIAMSFDGFIARHDHALDWLPQEGTDGEDFGYDAFMAGVDGLIMGRSTYETVLSFGDWPYPKPVVVLSRTLQDADVPDELAGKVRVSSLDPKSILDQLQAEGWGRAYVDGGQVVQSFIRAGLIDDMVVTVIPILIGDGRRLFGPLEADVELELLDSKAFPSGMIQYHYRLARPTPQSPSL